MAETPTPDPGSPTTKAVLEAKAALSPRVSVGRIVTYHNNTLEGVWDLAAIVTNVACIRPDTMVVCLCVFEALGTTFGVQGVKEGTNPGEWSWPERTQ